MDKSQNTEIDFSLHCQCGIVPTVHCPVHGNYSETRKIYYGSPSDLNQRVEKLERLLTELQAEFHKIKNSFQRDPDQISVSRSWIIR